MTASPCPRLGDTGVMAIHAGVVRSLKNVINVFMSPLVGGLSDRYGRNTRGQQSHLRAALFVVHGELHRARESDSSARGQAASQ